MKYVLVRAEALAATESGQFRYAVYGGELARTLLLASPEALPPDYQLLAAMNVPVAYTQHRRDSSGDVRPALQSRPTAGVVFGHVGDDDRRRMTQIVSYCRQALGRAPAALS